MLKTQIAQLVKGENLSREATAEAFDKIMSGEANDIQKAAFLTALAAKGETIDEITAAADVLRKYCTKVPHTCDAFEIVGTGGDKSDTFNISTTAAFILAAAGVHVAKHGNRAASSKCGAMDVAEALGADLNLSPEKSGKLLDEKGLCLLFAQKYHSAMKNVGAVRRELGIHTIFNIIGPLANPAFPKYQLMGVYDESLAEPLAEVLHNLGVENVMVVYGRDCLDEISLCGETFICEITGDEKKSYVITPEDIGLKRCEKSDLTGGTPAENADITRAILSGEMGKKRDAAVLNTSYAYHVVNPEVSPAEARKIIEDTIDTGKAMEFFSSFIAEAKED
ncbi:MAG: anthranilate phosphoribosyltransferase [Oscillospiraceae bacterium]|nr:anthranilate phosphoribosyltransferase [Oscillospiraceae bacterium]